jgi:DNA polymerase I-like protein with 3'-5' exonuclease and polymerase domains
MPSIRAQKIQMMNHRNTVKATSISSPQPVTVDFETLAIRDPMSRPRHPPPPIGVSIKPWNRPATYYAFAHWRGNTHTYPQAREALARAWANPGGILCHNAKYDVDVATTHMGMPELPWNRVHDTMFLLFLDNPQSNNLGLKESAQALLGIEPEEKDAVTDWFMATQPLWTPNAPTKLKKTKTDPKPRRTRPKPGTGTGVWVSPSDVPAYYAYVPPAILGPYANGDTDRTEALFRHLWPSVAARGMLPAYDRERRLMPALLRSERGGVRVDLSRLRRDVEAYRTVLARVSAWIAARVGVAPDMKLDGDAFVEALVASGLADPSKMGVTPTGKIRTNKEAITAGVADGPLAGMIQYRAQLKTCLNTFMETWLVQAGLSHGFINTSWNQVRGGGIGARTGRLSSTPNFQNIPKEFAPIFGAGAPCPILDLPPLPLCRSYIVPHAPDHVLVDRDACFSGDTEILTREGFVRFDQLKRGAEVAQWSLDGAINYAVPKAYQKVAHYGPMVHIHNPRSCDLLVTPSHHCLVLDRYNKCTTVRAMDYPVGNGFVKQPHAGVYAGSVDIDPMLARFIVALQADATIKYYKIDTTFIWKMKKDRKRARLREIFDALGLPYVEVPLNTCDQVMVSVRASALPDISRFIDITTKTFLPVWREVVCSARLVFLMELAWWDGRRNGPIGREGEAWSYFSTNMTNVKLVGDLAPITGLRANMHQEVIKSGKMFGTVSMRTRIGTFVKCYTKNESPGGGMVYCVTTHTGAIIVRRNGRTMVTGQSQQEIRILAHFEAGSLRDQYLDAPWTDFHDVTREKIREMFGRDYPRRIVKNVNFGIIYGQGVASLAAKNDATYDETKALKDAVYALYPGLKAQYDDARDYSIERRDSLGRVIQPRRPFVTWGGREYFAEPPIVKNNRVIKFDYKLVNARIQGSAAEHTKEAAIRLDASITNLGKRGVWFFVLQVHDSFLMSVPREDYEWANDVLRQCIESVEFDVPMLSEGDWSVTNWQDVKPHDRKGEVVENFRISDIAGSPRAATPRPTARPGAARWPMVRRKIA